jgi:hypothetical protein
VRAFVTDFVLSQAEIDKIEEKMKKMEKRYD